MFADEQFSCKLQELGPSAIDAEFRCLAPGAGGDVILMENMMEFLIKQLELRKDFELTQGYMALFLKVQYMWLIYKCCVFIVRLGKKRSCF
jgi:hypothetical protein